MMWAHILSLAKVSDKEMVDLVLHAMGKPLMQLSIHKCFVNPATDERPKTTEQEQKEKLENFILLQADSSAVEQASSFELTCLLAATIWLHLKRKFLNEGTSKDTCRMFAVREKQLSNILSGSRYIGDTEPKGPSPRGKKQKLVAAKNPDEDDENEDDPHLSAPKEDRSSMKGRPN